LITHNFNSGWTLLRVRTDLLVLRKVCISYKGFGVGLSHTSGRGLSIRPHIVFQFPSTDGRDKRFHLLTITVEKLDHKTELFNNWSLRILHGPCHAHTFWKVRR
jgi:hypothetical protein